MAINFSYSCAERVNLTRYGTNSANRHVVSVNFINHTSPLDNTMWFLLTPLSNAKCQAGWMKAKLYTNCAKTGAMDKAEQKYLISISHTTNDYGFVLPFSSECYRDLIRPRHSHNPIPIQYLPNCSGHNDIWEWKHSKLFHSIFSAHYVRNFRCLVITWVFVFSTKE